jgi:GT2 family glycosyltransferase
MPRIDLVAVNYFGSTSLRGLYQTLYDQSHKDWTLTVVDNSQDENELSAILDLERQDERVATIAADGNLGYFGGAMLGHETLDCRADWVIVTNTDIQLTSEVLQDLSALSLPDDVGVIAPSILTPSGRDQNPYMLSRPTESEMRRRRRMFASVIVARAVVFASSWRASRAAAEDGRGKKPSNIYAPHGSFIIFSREYFARGGNLRHPPFLFGEEVTVAEQCRAMGLSVRYAPELQVRHAEHQATGVWRSRQTLIWQREAVRYVSRLVGVDGQ